MNKPLPLKTSVIFSFPVEDCFSSHVSLEVFYSCLLQIGPDSHR